MKGPLLHLTSFAATAAVMAFSVIAFNAFIDPLGISPVRWLIPGINAEKPLRRAFDRLVKPFDVAIEKPRTVFYGSSRIKQTFDPTLLDGTRYAPAYNRGIDGEGSVGNIVTSISDDLKSDPRLRHVFIEIFLSTVLRTTPTPQPQAGLLDRFSQYVGAYFSVSAIADSVETISQNRAAPDASTQWTTGYAPIDPSSHHFSVKNTPNQMLWEKVSDPSDHVTAETEQLIGKAIAICHSQGIDCRFVITPMHSNVLYGMYRLGLWPEMEHLKRTLASLAPTYDFTQYSDLIDESAGPVRYWPEAYHYSAELGRIVTEVLVGTRPSGVSANFGELLAPDTIDRALAAWRDDRDRWIAANATVVRRYDGAFKDFDAGRTFKEVTQTLLSQGAY